MSSNKDNFDLPPLGLEDSVRITMDTSEVTDNPEGNNPPPNPKHAVTVNLPIQSLTDLTNAINAMREDLVIQRSMEQTEAGSSPNPSISDASRAHQNIRSSWLNNYPDTDQLCRHPYLGKTEPMEAN